ncbi:MAG: flagellar type III secretion system pore protein FliP [Clostridiales bacterium]|nr:flagellar type III secretion system pore protein FliP [Clostridiales bacterium]
MNRRKILKRALIVLTVTVILISATGAVAMATGLGADTALDGGATGGTLRNLVTTVFGENTETIDIIILLTILTLAPSILVMMTGFTRIVIVLGFIRNAMGMQQTPPNQVVIGLALFLTFFVMQPVLSEVYETAYIPYVEDEITQDEMFDRASVPLKGFMLRQVFHSDLKFFVEISGTDAEELEELPMSTVIPAFITSEIKRAFQIGFFLYIPFIIIDMVVASTLMAMGMMMLPPAMISLPFKVLLFVLVDGWNLVIKTVITGFG